MNRREKNKLETRQLILAAARKLFKSRGVAQCTMREIAKEAGTSPASVVVHFKNKIALMEAALIEDIDRTIGRSVASLPPEADLADSLLHIWEALFTFYDGNRDLYRVLVSGTAYLPDEASPCIARQMESFLTFLQNLIEGEKQAGYLHADVDPAIAAYNFCAMYFFVLIGFFRDLSLSPQAAVEMLSAMMHQYMQGILIDRRHHGRRP